MTQPHQQYSFTSPSFSSSSSSSSHSFVLASNPDSLNFNDQPHNSSSSPSPLKQTPQSNSSSKPSLTKENSPFLTSPSSPTPQSPSKPSDTVKGNTRSYKQIMRPVSPSDPPAVAAAGGGPRNRSRSRTRARKASSVVIESKEWEKIYHQQSNEEVEEEFEKMLTEREIPPALRVKLTSLESTVKSSMLRGQATLNLSSLADVYGTTSNKPRTRSRSPSKSNHNPNGRGAIPFKGIRKSKSSSSLAAEAEDEKRRIGTGTPSMEQEDEQLFVAPKRKSLFGGSNRSRSGGINGSSSSFHLPPSPEKGGANKSTTSVNMIQPSTNGKTRSRIRTTSFGKDVLQSPSSFRETPSTFAALLQNSSSINLSLPSLKRMRVLLSTESPIWLGEFISNGGYQGLISRLNEIFEMEWRDDVRDDGILHELLRGLNALAGTEKGKVALSNENNFPAPFDRIVDLLFSEKRPGDIGTRKLMVELMISMNSLQAEQSLRTQEHDSPKPKMDEAVASQDGYSKILSSRVPSSAFSLARVSCSSIKDNAFLILFLLLHNPRTPSQENLLAFVKEAHAQRPFKTYLTEVAGTCRDYFWIFCHSQNRFWRLNDVDVGEVEGPKVPGGMTGGVEFEAMGYLTTHLKLINTVASHLQDSCQGKKGAESMAAYEFHQMMFASGWERILATIRRSSQVYYAPLHLELARYFHLASLCRFQVPANLSVWLATPKSNKGAAPSLADQMAAANQRNERAGIPKSTFITALPNQETCSPQISNLPKIESLNLGLEKKEKSSPSPKKETPVGSQSPGKVRRELSSIPTSQPSSSQAVSNPSSPSKVVSPSSDAASAFAPTSTGLEQPFASGRWMANEKGIGLSSSPPKTSSTPRSESPTRQTLVKTPPTENSKPPLQDQKVSSSPSKPSSPVSKSSSSKRAISPKQQSRQHSTSNLVDKENPSSISSASASTTPSLGSPLPNPFDRFYPTQPQADSPILNQNLSKNIDTEMGPAAPKRGAQDSVVGTAIKRWEMRAQDSLPNGIPSKARGGSSSSAGINGNGNRLPAGAGLGIGWAGNR